MFFPFTSSGTCAKRQALGSWGIFSSKESTPEGGFLPGVAQVSGDSEAGERETAERWSTGNAADTDFVGDNSPKENGPGRAVPRRKPCPAFSGAGKGKHRPRLFGQQNPRPFLLPFPVLTGAGHRPDSARGVAKRKKGGSAASLPLLSNPRFGGGRVRGC